MSLFMHMERLEGTIPTRQEVKTYSITGIKSRSRRRPVKYYKQLKNSMVQTNALSLLARFIIRGWQSSSKLAQLARVYLPIQMGISVMKLTGCWPEI